MAVEWLVENMIERGRPHMSSIRNQIFKRKECEWCPPLASVHESNCQTLSTKQVALHAKMSTPSTASAIRALWPPLQRRNVALDSLLEGLRGSKYGLTKLTGVFEDERPPTTTLAFSEGESSPLIGYSYSSSSPTVGLKIDMPTKVWTLIKWFGITNTEESPRNEISFTKDSSPYPLWAVSIHLLIAFVPLPSNESFGSVLTPSIILLHGVGSGAQTRHVTKCVL